MPPLMKCQCEEALGRGVGWARLVGGRDTGYKVHWPSLLLMALHAKPGPDCQGRLKSGGTLLFLVSPFLMRTLRLSTQKEQVSWEERKTVLLGVGFDDVRLMT